MMHLQDIAKMEQAAPQIIQGILQMQRRVFRPGLQATTKCMRGLIERLNVVAPDQAGYRQKGERNVEINGLPDFSDHGILPKFKRMKRGFGRLTISSPIYFITTFMAKCGCDVQKKAK
jgi:hypothetical protein